MYVQSGALVPARVLWEASDSGGRRVVIFEDQTPRPDPTIIFHGANPAGRFASGSIFVDVLAVPKVI